MYISKIKDIFYEGISKEILKIFRSTYNNTNNNTEQIFCTIVIFQFLFKIFIKTKICRQNLKNGLGSYLAINNKRKQLLC